MMDITALLDRNRRRIDNLRKGGSAGPRTYDGPRLDAESPLDRPLLGWPSGHALVPRQCHHCGSRTLETNPPYDLAIDGETTCQLCSRTVVRWRADRPARAPLTAEDIRPNRGRPRGTRVAP